MLRRTVLRALLRRVPRDRRPLLPPLPSAFAAPHHHSWPPLLAVGPRRHLSSTSEDHHNHHNSNNNNNRNTNHAPEQDEHHHDVVTKYRLPADTHTFVGCPRPYPTTPTEVIAYKKKMIRSFPQPFIRNVSVVAHVDHGKTTLTDALLRRAGLLPEGATGTFTDRLAVERERGITIKAQTCSVFMKRRTPDGKEEEYLLNLIDTPGHVDFQYEVSRSLSASDAALLLMDVSQGVEAQTMAQFYAALEHDLTIIPVLTKMDQVLNDGQVDKAMQQLEDSTGLLRREAVLTSAKTKEGIEAVFAAIVDRVPPPDGREGFSDMRQLPLMHPESQQRREAEAALVPLRALLFDCWTAESSGMDNSHLADTTTTATTTNSNSKNHASPASSSDPTMDLRKGGAPLAKEGVYCLVRVFDGTVTPETKVTFFHSRRSFEVQEVGIIHPTLHPTAALTAGMVGYVFVPGLKKSEIRIGDTLCTVPTKKHSLAPPTQRVQGEGATTTTTTTSPTRATEEEEGETATTTTTAAAAAADSPYIIRPVPGFKQVQPVVFAGFYPDEDDFISQLKEAVDLLCINDPSVTVEPLQCQALGQGLQLGFLGLLHMQVFKERLLAEFNQSVLVTPPQVQYKFVATGDDPNDERARQVLTVQNWRWPHEGVQLYLEPYVHATVVTPRDYLNAINQAAMMQFRGEQEDMRVIDDARVVVRYRMPLADLARGFFSLVKSASRGYATLDYDEPVYVESDLVKVDMVINKAKISALSLICPRRDAQEHGRRMTASLKENLLRSTVDLPLQALLGNKIIARETVKAYRKDVTAKIHAGDISRKQKKWADQKKGKERMAKRSLGTVTLDQNVLAAAMGATTAK